jgi:predicted TIM-barrel fold metal-dependent hydrolase
MTPSEHHVVISADCHAGADLWDYKNYLEKKYHEQFDEWANEVEERNKMIQATMGEKSTRNVGVGGDPEKDADRNWNSERRLKEQLADGVVAEVVFPNTLPPFAPIPANMFEAPRLSNDGELRFAGLKAHNRWAADYVSQAPEQRSALIQVFLGDVAGSVKELEWAKENNLRGGMLLPGAPPGSGFEPLYAPCYEPLWAKCEELDFTVTHHSGGGVPEFGPYFPASLAMFMLEVTWWGHRAMWHLMFSGVFERHPNLRFVNTETGTKWVVDTLEELDGFYDRMKYGTHGSETLFGYFATKDLPERPSTYWKRQCHVGASFLRPIEADLRDKVGIENIAWGSDYPHLEASWPYTSEHLRNTFGGIDIDEVAQMLTYNSARLYHFDVEKLRPLAEKHCLTAGEVFGGIDYASIPAEATHCPGLMKHTQRNAA